MKTLRAICILAVLCSFFLIDCAKEVVVTKSPVIYARRRQFGVAFQVKAAEGLRPSMVEDFKTRFLFEFKKLYKADKVEDLDPLSEVRLAEFRSFLEKLAAHEASGLSTIDYQEKEGVKVIESKEKATMAEWLSPSSYVMNHYVQLWQGLPGRQGDITALTFQMATLGFDDMVMIDGTLSSRGFEGEIKVNNAASGGWVLPSTQVNASLIGSKGPVESTVATMIDLFVKKYKDPNAKPEMDELWLAGDLYDHFIELADKSSLDDIKSPNLAEYAVNLARSMVLFEKVRQARDFLTADDIMVLQEIVEKRDKAEEWVENYWELVDEGSRGFEMVFEFQDIAPRYQEMFRRSAEKTTLKLGGKNYSMDKILRYYTNKPVKISIAYDPADQQGFINLKLRYNKTKFLKRQEKIPKKFKGKQVIDFDHYEKLQYAVYLFYVNFLNELSASAKDVFKGFQLTYTLRDRAKSYLKLPIRRAKKSKGEFKDAKRGAKSASRKQRLFAPPGLISIYHKDLDGEMQVKTFKPHITNKYGYFILGPTSDPSGNLTKFGYVARFLGLK